MQNETNSKKKITSKQVVAIISIILLVLLYIITFVLALVGTEESTNLFGTCLLATIFVPLVIWIYTWIYGKMTGKHTIADSPEYEESDTTTDSENSES